MVRSIGADRVIDYTREDFTRSGERYDLLLDNVGNHSLSACRRALASDGALVMNGAPHDIKVIRALAELGSAMVLSWFVRQKLAFFVAKSNEEDLKTLAELMAARKIVPVVDRRYPLSEVVEALRYLEEGHARGKVVVTFDEPGV
jgi:NADPH:quinone reductase-like Zn-dependent oxidoreductase